MGFVEQDNIVARGAKRLIGRIIRVNAEAYTKNEETNGDHGCASAGVVK